MYQFSYAEVVDDLPQEMRAREFNALAHAVDMLKASESAGAQSNQAREALTFLRRLWSIFLDDLSTDGNELPDNLRAELISIGIWIMKEVERIRANQSNSLADLIEINEIIRDGLR